jgi:hypothetical protein
MKPHTGLARATLRAAALALLFTGSLHLEGGQPRIALASEAHAVVGRPLTPVSVAGVARRTTRRTVARTSAYVAALPPNCVNVNINGAVYHQCGATYYQASGSQYVVVHVN